MPVTRSTKTALMGTITEAHILLIVDSYMHQLCTVYVWLCVCIYYTHNYAYSTPVYVHTYVCIVA